MSERHDRLAEAVRALVPRSRTRSPADDEATRLAHLEEDVREIRTRVNALFFTVIAVALGDLVGRLVVS